MRNEQVKRQNVKYKQPLFQYEIYPLVSKSKDLKPGPAHWHTEFEICYCLGGSIIYKTANKEYCLKEGDVVFVNADVIHSVTPLAPTEMLNMSVHFIDDSFISGGRGNAFDVEYVFPIKDNENIDMILFSGNSPRAEMVRNIISENIQLKKKKDKFWEFRIRNNISLFWECIVEETQEINTAVKLVTVRDSVLRDAMTFIQEQYTSKVTLNDIALHVHISTRELSRKFMKHLNITPMNYLLSVRLQKASKMLQDTEKSIGDIAFENGFSGGSHFTKIFKEHYKLTPIEYRNNLNGKR